MKLKQDLTFRQIELVVHVANGLRAGEIAERMHLSESSVRQTLDKARARAGARTQAHLVSLCIVSGIIVWSDDENEQIVQENERGPADSRPSPGGSSR